ncbi:deoxyguanosinetriphosphate triphosphohydrolase [Listeria fleischmannii]|jgi:dGTPase|uniref:Deoxyguanosinetriphosphate triphosphohydrolase n=1 Tax=Listeria fleischmannii TaxID=1069827 RepID=A0A841YCH8_9LIST|nr:deoxyguanosinetriphosphate triphosphohydrolase [Listeria fleischmannii]MBC1397966.1 deoxyguanosinetriphosphate triphosphohydrolase [Listeria fleischmannii]MBC1417802.1 deoxyguanosinetriphosphate triphosphohydrolase [Listeria fleischmannii]MBC1426027.1 deoxyguanosinetriphosphate triphosphohydrolase [Listeria fleischmannii]STY34299.1 Deoxyguanosinetriphosphate triphosphohydrolase [Listeria fleischmannii subsp. coloradonensis]
MKWDELLNDKRRRESSVTRAKSTDVRSAFENDYQRIVMSASFRRLQDKTQIFPLEKSDFVRTRLTHSMEVSTIAKSMGNMVSHTILNEKLDDAFTREHAENMADILSCAGLLHDMGNPPFGHFGEESIREWFRENLATLTYNGEVLTNILNEQMKQDFYNFEGNAQVLRVVSKLHYLFDEYGLNLTHATLNSIIKYPVSSLKINKKQIRSKKLGYFYADEAIFHEVTEATGAGNSRHPLTFLLEVADDIAYLNADLEDGVKKGTITIQQILRGFEEVPEHNWVTAACFNELKKKADRYAGQEEGFIAQQWLASNVRGQLINRSLEKFYENYAAIMAGTFQDSLLDVSEAFELVQVLQNLSATYIYTNQGVVESEIAGNKIITSLLDSYIPAVLYYDSAMPEKVTAKDKRLLSLISDNYIGCYRKNATNQDETTKLYLRLLLITDFICGMTDSYAKDLYQELNGLR